MSRTLPPLSLSLQFGDFDDAALKQRHRAGLTRHRVQRSLRHALAADVEQAEITVRIVDSAEGQALNQSYRQKDYATNVLTFAYSEAPFVAAELGKPLAEHYTHLLVHGALHAQGWDHETSDEDADAMEAEEIRILHGLGLDNPYQPITD